MLPFLHSLAKLLEHCSCKSSCRARLPMGNNMLQPWSASWPIRKGPMPLACSKVLCS